MEPMTDVLPPEEMHHWLVTKGLRILLIVLLSIVAVRVGRLFIQRMERRLLRDPGDDLKEIENQKRLRTLVGIFRTTALILIASVATLTVLAELDVNLGPIIAAAGIGGLAIGFGAQTLVKDWISGFFLLIEDQLRVGDIARINGVEGVVEGITLRFVRLRDASGVVHFITNGSIGQVSNLTKEFSFYPFMLVVAAREDPERVMKALWQVAERMRAEPEWNDDMIEPIEILGIESLTDAGYTVRARLKTQPSRHLAVGREFTLRVKHRFDGEGIHLAPAPAAPAPASPPAPPRV
ncbi:MAG: mechanosensitive ion channel family protein [Candidatus Eisenbacteria bacterium]|nr:mechanosensitive ion channel family protein [Candidatus Eisenbacteria bacterium]MCC7141123.1 mechanosensitive ion channel family protein [Candidatus Eisenbacteria bacterium]